MWPRCAWLITMSLTPARESASSSQTIRDFPRTSRRHLGTRSESGRMRSPRPAARIIAFMAQASESVADALLRRIELVEQARERSQAAVALAGAPQVAHHAGLILQVAVLAVPERKAREDAQHLQLPLDSHPFEIAVEIGELPGDGKARTPRLFPVPDRPIDHALFFPGNEIG